MAIGAGLLALPGWVPLQLAHAPLIGGMGLAGALGQIALTRAFQLGEASMIAPLEYSGLVWVIGWDRRSGASCPMAIPGWGRRSSLRPACTCCIASG